MNATSGLLDNAFDIAFESETASGPVQSGGKTRNDQLIAQEQNGRDGVAKYGQSVTQQNYEGMLSTPGQDTRKKEADDSIRLTALAIIHQTCTPVQICFAGLRGFLLTARSYAVIKIKLVVSFLHFLVTFPTSLYPAELNSFEQLPPDDEMAKRGCGTASSRVAWLEVITVVFAVVHTAVLSNYRHEMDPKSKTLLQTMDMGMVLAFAGVEFLRVIAFEGIIKYLSRGPGCQFDFFISSVTLVVWAAGWNSWLQLSAFRLIKLLPVLLELPGMGQARKVLHVAIGRPVDLAAGVLVFGCSLLVCSFGGMQILGKATFENGENYFGSFTSSIITIFGMAIGEEMKEVFQAGFNHIGAPAVIFVLGSSVLLDKIVGHVFTAIFLTNFVVSDKDRVAYQLQFEKLCRLWGWSEEQVQNEWMTSNRPHKELLHEFGQPSILHPDAAGIFRRIRKATSHQKSAFALACAFSLFSTLRRWIERIFCRSSTSHNGVQRFLSILVLRGQRLHLLESPNVSPHIFICARLEDVDKSEEEGGSSLEQVDSNMESNSTGIPPDNEPRRASQTTILETWDPEWREELFIGPVLQTPGFTGLGVGHVVFEVWCVPELNRNRTKGRKSWENMIQKDDQVEEVRVPDVLLGSCRQRLSHLSQYHASIAVLPLQEPGGKDVADSLCEDAKHGDPRKTNMDDKKGPTITVRFMTVASKISNGNEDEALASCWKWVACAVRSKWVDRMMLSLIVGCTWLVFVESESEGSDGLETVREAIDLMFLVIVFLEILVKIAVFGAFFSASGSDEPAYFRSGWHQLDALLAIGMVLAHTVHDALSRVFVFRTIRLLRPLMAISRFSGLRTASVAVFNSSLVIFSLLSMSGIFLCGWSIASLYAFTGKLDNCVGNSKLMTLSKLDCSHFIAGQDGVIRPLVWGPPEWEHFDEFRMAFLTMFRALNSNGWTRVVQQVLAAGHTDSKLSGIDRRQAEENALPFLFLQILVHLIILQCIVAILINAIDVSRRRAFLTRAQRALKATKTLAMQTRDSFVKDPAPGGIKRLQRIIYHNLFERFATIMIMLNTGVLLTEYHGASPGHSLFKEIANFCFIIWYTVEQGLKLLALSTSFFVPTRHGQRSIAWINIFDLTVTLCAVMEVSGLLHTSGINVLRSVRVLRLLELIPSMRTLIHACRKSFKVILGCFSMLLIMSSSYAVVGSAGFAGVKYGEHLNRNSNFDSPYNALIVMCRIIGGEDWPSIMNELTVSPPFCTAGTVGDCGSLWAIPFLVSFDILVKYFFLPLCLASIVCCCFETVGQDAVITPYDLRLFVRTWQMMDPNRTGFIDVWKIRSLLERLVAAKSLLGIDPVRRAKHIEGLILHLEKSRRASIDARRQAVTDGMSFLDVVMSLICAYKYPWCVFGDGTGDQGAAAKTLSSQGGVLEVWARRRNALTIRDALLLPSWERRVGSIGAPAGKVWESFEGLLHVWIIGAHNLPRASLHGSYCNVTLLHAEEKWKRRREHAFQSKSEVPLEEQSSLGHSGPLSYGWLDEHYIKNQYGITVQPSPSPGHFPQANDASQNVSKRTNDEDEQLCEERRGRGTGYNTKIRHGSRDPEWNAHFVIPIVSTDCSILISAAEDSAGAGHKMLFGSVEVSVDSLVRQPPGVFRYPLSAGESRHAGNPEDEGGDEPLTQKITRPIRSLTRQFSSYHESAEITVRFLYKSMDEARLQVAAQAFQCLDAAFEPESEPAPSAAATLPENPEQLYTLPENPEQLYTEFSTQTLGVEKQYYTKCDCPPGCPAASSGAASFSIHQGNVQLEDDNGPEIDGVRRAVSGVCHGDLPLSNSTGKGHVSEHQKMESKASVNRLAPVLASQFLSYFGQGKADKVSLFMSRRRDPCLHAEAHPTASAPKTADMVSSVVPYKPARATGPETMQVVVDTTKNKQNKQPVVLAPLEEACEDEDESQPVPLQMEIGEVPTLSGHVSALLSTPRGAYNRRIKYARGRKPVDGTDDASTEGSMGSNSSLSTLRGIVQERRELVEDRLKYLQSTFFSSMSNFTPRTKQHGETSEPNIANLQPAPVSELEQTQGAHRMSSQMLISKELLDSSGELSVVSSVESQQSMSSNIAPAEGRNEVAYVSPNIQAHCRKVSRHDAESIAQDNNGKTPTARDKKMDRGGESEPTSKRSASKKKGKASGGENRKGEDPHKGRGRKKSKEARDYVLSPADSGITVSSRPAMTTVLSHEDGISPRS